MRKTDEYLRLYRPDVEKFIFLELFFGKSDKWSIQIVSKKNENFLKEKIIKKFQQKKFQTFWSVVNSADIFCTSARLSLKTDQFILVEYIEQNPLILSGFGMCSKIERWIYITRFAYQVMKKHGYELIPKD